MIRFPYELLIKNNMKRINLNKNKIFNRRANSSDYQWDRWSERSSQSRERGISRNVKWDEMRWEMITGRTRGRGKLKPQKVGTNTKKSTVKIQY